MAFRMEPQYKLFRQNKRKVEYARNYSPAGKHSGDGNGANKGLVASAAAVVRISGVSKSVLSVMESSVLVSFPWCGLHCS